MPASNSRPPELGTPALSIGRSSPTAGWGCKEPASFIALDTDALITLPQRARAQLSTAASHAPAASTVADSSMRIERPIARSASRVERQAGACRPSRRRSSR